MTDLIQYACASAIAVDKQVKRQAQAVATSGAGGKKSIIDGYIVATARTSNGTITRVIDTPAQITWLSWWTFGDGGGDVRFATINTSVRDLFLPRGKPPKEAVVASAENAFVPVFEGAAFIPPYVPLGVPRRAPGAPVLSDGDWCHSCIMTMDDNEGSVAAVHLFALRWDTRMTPYTPAYTGITITPPAAGIEPRTAGARVLSIPLSAVTAAAGASGVVVRQWPSNVLLPAARVIGDEVFMAQCAHDFTDGVADRLKLVLLVWHSRMPVADHPAPSVLWAAAVPILDDASIPGAVIVDPSAFDYCAIHVGEVVTVLAPANAGADEHYTSTLVTLNRATGVVIESVVWTNGANDLAAPLCVTPGAMWAVRATRAPGATEWSASSLYCVVGLTRTLVDLDGWQPISYLLPGTDTLSMAYRATVINVVVEVSAGRALVAVAPAGVYDLSDSVPVHLVEIDTEQLTVVSVRGLIGMQTTRGMGVNLSVVTPQVLDDAGNVRTPAVLLSNIDKSTRISTDGGYTWSLLANGCYGTPVYRGNRLHPFKLGEAL